MSLTWEKTVKIKVVVKVVRKAKKKKKSWALRHMPVIPALWW